MRREGSPHEHGNHLITGSPPFGNTDNTAPDFRPGLDFISVKAIPAGESPAGIAVNGRLSAEKRHALGHVLFFLGVGLGRDAAEGHLSYQLVALRYAELGADSAIDDRIVVLE